ncbi:hypothetical protein BGZ65_005606, partial [Modicella reniformis]
CGEDLRLNQRIQQLFTLMDGIMRKDPQCSKQDISVDEYKVIPNWVGNTKSLKNYIEEELSNEDVWKRTQKQYGDFVMSFNGDDHKMDDPADGEGGDIDTE